MPRYLLMLAGLALTLAALVLIPGGALWEVRGENAAPFAALENSYLKEVRPIVQRHCIRCHSTKKPEGDVNLEATRSLAEVRKAPRVWQKVLEMLDTEQMPPKDTRQPTEAERTALQTWVRSYLKAEARAQAGDPGPVVLRRLNNAEYTYTLRDLTGVDLDPARQFPVDAAAGEGFTNTGQSLVMSPALLTKYLDAARAVAAHAVLLPDGLRFSPSTTRSDWTNEILAQIRQLYGEQTRVQSAGQVNLQGIVFTTNEGGRIPLERYLAATLLHREALRAGTLTPQEAARRQGLNPKYLGLLWKALTSTDDSPLLAALRQRWAKARPGEEAGLVGEVDRWQKALTRFQSVGHMKAWMVPVVPLATSQELRYRIPITKPGQTVSVYLEASDAGDGSAQDQVVFEQPRLVIPGRPDVLVRDVAAFTREIQAARARYFASTEAVLRAAAESLGASGTPKIAELAQRHKVPEEVLVAWFDYLGIRPPDTFRLNHFTKKIERSGDYDFVKGWGTPETPIVVANSTARHVRIPGNLRPHGVCVHPSPTLNVAVGWQSPVRAVVALEGKITHAHPECGNGVTWTVELRRGATRRRLAQGIAHGGQPRPIGPFPALEVQPGDLVSVIVGPRDGNHACDLTDVDLTFKEKAAPARTWNLSADVSPDVLAGNPHADRQGNKAVWHFYTEPVDGRDGGQVVPQGSLLAQWMAADKPAEKARLAGALHRLLLEGPAPGGSAADALLVQHLTALGGPLLGRVALKPSAAPNEAALGIEAKRFGTQPGGPGIDAASVGMQAPGLVEVRLPGGLFDGAELVTQARLHPTAGAEGSVQVRIVPVKPQGALALTSEVPLLVGGGKARPRWERAFDDFRQLFPAALCYTRIVPVDEVVTLTLYHREDEPLCRLFLDDAQKARLDRLWDELHFVSQDALTLVDAYNQLMEYATQDSNPKLFEPFRKPIHDRAAAFRKALVAAEPRQVEGVLEFAGRAFRRPLSEAEQKQLRQLYADLRQQGMPHDEALRLTLARVLVAPAFLYRLEAAAPGVKPGPLSGTEQANRLSYFLWSSLPDAALRAANLSKTETLVAQTQRMLRDERIRRMAIEFGCQWLHVHGFDRLDEKSERHFPTFGQLRGPMYEEAILFFTDLLQKNGSILSLLDADHAYLNEALANHYGIPGVKGADFRRVEGVRKHGRGGILGLGATLAKQSGASRTSPILRGNWVSEVLLGEKLPRPPKDVPQLPEDEAGTGLTVRQMIEKHSSDARCSGCHVRIDAFGFALESYDAIGRRRERDLGNRPIDARSRLKDGTELDGVEGLKRYLLVKRRDDFVYHFCRKLLGYALARGVQLSDEPLLEEMRQKLAKHDYRIGTAIEVIVTSQQFRQIRGKEFPTPDAH